MDLPGYITIPYKKEYYLMIYQSDIISSDTYLNSSKTWGDSVYSSNYLIGADSFSEGKENTARIAASTIGIDTAARTCLNLTTTAGYVISDWHLASVDELLAVRNAGYLPAGPYMIWTSTEKGAHTAYAMDADSGDILEQSKNGSYFSLPVRRYFPIVAENRAIEGSAHARTKGLKLHVDPSNRRSYSPNLVNYSVWSAGSGSISEDPQLFGITGFDAIGWHGEDSRSVGTDPFGMTAAIVWNASTTDDTLGTIFDQSLSRGDGGWNSGYAAIDSGKMYRFSIWVKKNIGALSSGYTYLGLNSMGDQGATWSAIKNSGDIGEGWNSYFHYTESTSPPEMGGSGEWSLFVGHVWPHYTDPGTLEPGSNLENETLAANFAHPDSGIWTTAGKIGNLINSDSGSAANGSDWIWNKESKSARHRAYLYYGAETGLDPELGFIATTASFIYPRIDLVDGSEPSVKELISGTEPIRNLAGPGVAYAKHHTSWSPEGGGSLVMQRSKFMGFVGTMSAPFEAAACAVWFYADANIVSGSAAQALLSLQTLVGGSGLTIYLGDVTGLSSGEVITVSEYPNKVTVAKDISIEGGKWHMVAISWKLSKYDIYLDGAKLTTYAGSSGHATLQTATGEAMIGGRKASGYEDLSFDGKLSSVMAWDRALEDAEVSDMWQAGRSRLR